MVCRTQEAGQLTLAGLSLLGYRHTHQPIHNPHVSPAPTLSCQDDYSCLLAGVLILPCSRPCSSPIQTLPGDGETPQPLGPPLSDPSSSHFPLHYLWSSCSLGTVDMHVPQGLCTCCSKTLFSLSILVAPSFIPLHLLSEAHPDRLPITAYSLPSPHPNPFTLVFSFSPSPPNPLACLSLLPSSPAACDPCASRDGGWSYCLLGCWCLGQSPAPGRCSAKRLLDEYSKAETAASGGRQLFRPAQPPAPGTRSGCVAAGTHLQSRDTDAVHQVGLVGLQQRDEDEELVPAAHLVLVICNGPDGGSGPPRHPISCPQQPPLVCPPRAISMR